MFVLTLGGSLPDPSFSQGTFAYHGPKDWLDETGTEITVTYADGSGAFSRAAFDRATGRLTVTSDITGQMALRYVIRDGAVYLASHDIALAPFCAYEADEVTLAHIRKASWSVGNHSLIKGISVAKGGETLTFENGAVTVTPAHFPTEAQPLEIMLEYFGKVLPEGPVNVELSAGFDSRASLAATLACKEAGDITLFTEGPDDSLDVIVAKKIAAMLNIPLNHISRGNSTVDDFFENWTRATLANNGHIEVNILASANKEADTPVSVCGDGGEIYRGYYYGYQPFQRLTYRIKGGVAHNILKKMGESERSRAAIARLSADGASEAVVGDRFYLAERFGIWNQKIARWSNRRISPFFCRASMANLGNGLTSDVHRDLIGRYLPDTMGMPVNDDPAPRLYRPGLLTETRLETQILYAKLRRKLVKSNDLAATRGSFVDQAMASLPEGFLMAPGKNWADFGAQRFLKLYQEAAAG